MALHTSVFGENFDSVGMMDQMLEQSGVNQNFIEYVNSLYLNLRESLITENWHKSFSSRVCRT